MTNPITPSTFDEQLIEIFDPTVSAYASTNAWFDGHGSYEELYESEMARLIDATKQLVARKVGNDEELITPENYAKFSKNNASLFYENRAIDTRNKFRANLLKALGIEQTNKEKL